MRDGSSLTVTGIFKDARVSGTLDLQSQACVQISLLGPSAVMGVHQEGVLSSQQRTWPVVCLTP